MNLGKKSKKLVKNCDCYRVSLKWNFKSRYKLYSGNTIYNIMNKYTYHTLHTQHRQSESTSSGVDEDINTQDNTKIELIVPK